jgi:recombination protein RecA
MPKASSEDKLKKMEEKLEGKDKEVIGELIKLLEGDAAEEVQTTEWVSTGIKAFNFLLSGDVDKGIPAGKMVVVAGEQQSGKSILAARIAAHSQKKDYIVLWLDSEHASDKRFLARVGLDVNKVVYRDLDTVEEFQSLCIKALNKAKEKGLKLFIVLDSLGALSGAKEMSDANDDKMTQDMGLRAKNIRTAFKQVIHRLNETESCFFCINHTYISPGFIPKKEMGGGTAPWFLAQIVLFLTKLKGEDGVSSRVRIKAKKNREFIEGRVTEFEINFREGINPNDGLMDLFDEFGVVKKKGSWYNIDGDETEKSYREEDILKNETIMNKALDTLKEKTKNYTYSSFTPIQ